MSTHAWEELAPAEIEKRSFEIITQELGGRALDAENAPVIKRCIHTSADFDYADSLYFTPHAVRVLQDALLAGADIVTDTQMAQAGINKTRLARWGGQVHCFIADPDVAAEARRRGVTRSTVSMEKAAALQKPLIFAIGNAPTALRAVVQLAEAGRLQPAGVIGVPVGFVHVVESKELLIASGLPCIAARGRKGGSNIAAAIVNALLYAMPETDDAPAPARAGMEVRDAAHAAAQDAVQTAAPGVLQEATQGASRTAAPDILQETVQNAGQTAATGAGKAAAHGGAHGEQPAAPARKSAPKSV